MKQQGKFKQKLPDCLKGYIDQDDGDFWKVTGNFMALLDEAKADFPMWKSDKEGYAKEAYPTYASEILNAKRDKWFEKWFGK